MQWGLLRELRSVPGQQTHPLHRFDVRANANGRARGRTVTLKSAPRLQTRQPRHPATPRRNRRRPTTTRRRRRDGVTTQENRNWITDGMTRNAVAQGDSRPRDWGVWRPLWGLSGVAGGVVRAIAHAAQPGGMPPTRRSRTPGQARSPLHTPEGLCGSSRNRVLCPDWQVPRACGWVRRRHVSTWPGDSSRTSGPGLHGAPRAHLR